jgi:hypothetical protein
VLDAYAPAVAASAELAVALDIAAVAADAPTRAIAVVRAASAERRPERKRTAGRHAAGLADPARALASGSAWASAEAVGTGLPRPGPVERQVRDLGVDDAILLLRAKAIDKAARDVLAQAQDAASADIGAAQPAGVPQPGAATNSVAAVAARSFPQGRAGLTTTRRSASSDGQRRGVAAGNAPVQRRPAAT